MRRRVCAPLFAICVPLSFATPDLAAQEAPDNRPVTVSVGGLAAPNIAGSLKSGWDIEAGGGFAVTRWSHRRDWRLYLDGSFLFEHLGVTQSALQTAQGSNGQLSAGVTAKDRFYAATLDPTVRLFARRRLSGYVLGGFGWLRRSTDYSMQAMPGVLIPPAVSGVLSPSANSAAFDAGAGLNYRVRGPWSPMLFVEGRYVRGFGVNWPAPLIPVAVGVRW